MSEQHEIPVVRISVVGWAVGNMAVGGVGGGVEVGVGEVIVGEFEPPNGIIFTSTQFQNCSGAPIPVSERVAGQGAILEEGSQPGGQE